MRRAYADRCKMPSHGDRRAAWLGLAAALAVTATLLLSAPAAAQDIFIRPAQQQQQQQQAPATGDLGLRPRAPAAQGQAGSAATPRPAPAAAPAQAPVQQATPAAQPLIYAPQPASVPPQTAYAPVANVPGSGFSAQQTPGGANIITLNTPPTPLPTGRGNNGITVALQPGAVGPGDKQLVAHTLGLTEAELVNNCVFENAVAVGVNGGASGDVLQMGQQQNAAYRYEGGLTSVDVLPTLACRKVKPPIGGLVIEENGLYKLSLNMVSCPPNTHNSNVAFSFRYLGDGKGTCAFQ